MLFIKGFEIKETLHQGNNTIVLKAIRLSDSKAVILKTLLNSYPKQTEVYRLTHDFQVGSKLGNPGFPNYIDFFKSENRPVIVMDDFGGSSLKKYLQQNELSLDLFFEIAFKCCAILHRLSKKNIIHCDIKPDNILINENTRDIQFIDFGSSSGLNIENPYLNLTSEQKVTLAYVSPEQTGRMNRSVDYRTDFYSLGITFYKMLSGHLPFDSADPMEIVYAQIARQPVPLHQKDSKIPVPLSMLVSKLMAKTAEDRYQSTNGLLYDLELICGHYQKNEGDIQIKLGTKDRSSKFKVSQKLYGREENINSLINFFNDAAGGNSQLVIIDGYSGVGKTALIREIQKPVLEKRGYFISGKFDQLKKDIPYSAIVHSLADFVKKILTESDEKIEAWKNIINAALGINAVVLMDLIPELQLIIGEKPPVQSLSSQESENRFIEVFRSFLKAICHADNPMALFMDDLQWADVASLKLMRILLSDREIKYLLAIGAYRKNEVSDTHPLILEIETLKKIRLVNTIHLAPLTLADTANLISDTLLTNKDEAAEISGLIFDKTHGTPFFIIWFLEILNKENLIVFDVNAERWTWNISEIKQLKITDNVAALLIENIKQHDEGLQELLRVASCMGNEFNAERLAWNMDLKLSIIGELLSEASRLKFIQPLNDNYKKLLLSRDTFVEDTFLPETVVFRFLHDKIQQAAYSLLTPSRKAQIHYQTGNKLLAKYSGEQLEENIFDIVSHLNQAGDLFQTEAEKVKFAEMNMLAGIKARKAASYESALNFFNAAGRIFGGQAGWENYHEQTFNIGLYKCECLYLSGDNKMALAEIEPLLDKALTKLHILSVYELKCELLTKMGQLQDSIDTGIKLLRLFGFKIPSGKKGLQVAILTELMKARWRVHRIGKNKLIDMPSMKDLSMAKLQNFILRLEIALFQSNTDLFVLLMLKGLNISLKHGRADSTHEYIIGYGIILTASLKIYSAIHEFGFIALQMSEKYSNEAIKWKSRYSYHNFCSHWAMNARIPLDELLEIYSGNLENGDPVYGGYALVQRMYKKISLGFNLEEVHAEGMKYIKLFKDRAILAPLLLLQPRLVVVDALLGKTKDNVSLGTDDFDEEATVNFYRENKLNSPLALINFDKLQLFFLHGKYREALPYAYDTIKFAPYLTGLFLIGEYNLYACLNLTNAFDSAKENEKPKILKYIKIYLNNLKDFCNTNAENFESLYLIALAEWHRIKNKYSSAEALYDQAIQVATKSEHLQFQAIANELAGSYYLKKGREKTCISYITDSYYNYRNWGAKTKVKQLEQQYPHLIRGIKSELMEDTFSSSSDSQLINVSGSLDLSSILKASQAISSEIIIEKLLQKMMLILMENAAAEKTVLVLNENGKLNVRAKSDINIKEVEIINIPLHHYKEVPAGLIQYSLRTSESLVLEDARRDERFSRDPYIETRQPVSVISYPISSKGNLTGCIYFENNLSIGAFTEARLRLIKLLSGQITVSLENAMLYDSLDQKVQERTNELFLEKKKSDDLLLNILPAEIASELKQKGNADARLYDNVTVIFTDFVNFTSVAEKVSPTELVNQLHSCFKTFDEIISKYNIEKIKTIGDSYLAVSGLPTANQHHATDVVNAAMEICNFIKQHQTENINSFAIRVGVNSGSVVAGIVGVKKFAYDIWGDTVNTAARMEQNSMPGRINISSSTYELVKDQFVCQYRGKISAKNKGDIDMYFVDDFKTYSETQPDSPIEVIENQSLLS